MRIIALVFVCVGLLLGCGKDQAGNEAKAPTGDEAKKPAGEAGGAAVSIETELQKLTQSIVDVCKANDLNAAAPMFSRGDKVLTPEAPRLKNNCKEVNELAEGSTGMEFGKVTDEDKGKFQVLPVTFKKAGGDVTKKFAFGKVDGKYTLVDID